MLKREALTTDDLTRRECVKIADIVCRYSASMFADECEPECVGDIWLALCDVLGAAWKRRHQDTGGPRGIHESRSGSKTMPETPPLVETLDALVAGGQITRATAEQALRVYEAAFCCYGEGILPPPRVRCMFEGIACRVVELTWGSHDHGVLRALVYKAGHVMWWWLDRRGPFEQLPGGSIPDAVAGMLREL